MSGNAALAAAKRRRNPASGNIVDHSSSQEIEPISKKTYSFQSLISEHDFKIFKLEKLISNTSSNSSNINQEQIIGLVNNAENMAKTNSAEIRLLKSTVQKQNKMQQEINSLLTTLRATLNAQTSELNTLRLQTADLQKSKNWVDNSTQAYNTSDPEGSDPGGLVTDVGNMNLEIVEKEDQ